MGNTTWITTAIQDAITDAIQTWLAQHPTLTWLLTHPLWSLAIALLVVFLLWGLLQSIARFAERTWVAMFRLPLQLLGWIVSGLIAMVRGKPRHPSAANPTPEQQQVDQLLQRLHQVQQEQDALVQEIRTLLQRHPALDRSPDAIAPAQRIDAR